MDEFERSKMVKKDLSRKGLALIVGLVNHHMLGPVSDIKEKNLKNMDSNIDHNIHLIEGIGENLLDQLSLYFKMHLEN